MDLSVILVHHAPLKVPRQKSKTSQQPDWRQTWSVCVLNSEWIWPERLYFRSNLGDQSWLHLNTVAYAGRCKKKWLVPGGKPQRSHLQWVLQECKCLLQFNNLTDINFHMWGRKLAFKPSLPSLRIKLHERKKSAVPSPNGFRGPPTRPQRWSWVPRRWPPDLQYARKQPWPRWQHDIWRNEVVTLDHWS